MEDYLTIDDLQEIFIDENQEGLEIDEEEIKESHPLMVSEAFDGEVIINKKVSTNKLKSQKVQTVKFYNCRFENCDLTGFALLKIAYLMIAIWIARFLENVR